MCCDGIMYGFGANTYNDNVMMMVKVTAAMII